MREGGGRGEGEGGEGERGERGEREGERECGKRGENADDPIFLLQNVNIHITRCSDTHQYISYS